MKDQRIFIIRRDGTIEGLWCDALQPVVVKADGVKIARVSEIEYDNERRGWFIKFLPPFYNLNELPETKNLLYDKREQALNVEIVILNQYLTAERGEIT